MLFLLTPSIRVSDFQVFISVQQETEDGWDKYKNCFMKLRSKLMAGDTPRRPVNTPFQFEFKLFHLAKGQLSISTSVTLSYGQLHKHRGKGLFSKLNLRQPGRASEHKTTFMKAKYLLGQWADSRFILTPPSGVKVSRLCVVFELNGDKWDRRFAANNLTNITLSETGDGDGR